MAPPSCLSCEKFDGDLRRLPCEHVLCLDCCKVIDETTRTANIIVCPGCGVKHRLDFPSEQLPSAVCPTLGSQGSDAESLESSSTGGGDVMSQRRSSSRRRTPRKMFAATEKGSSVRKRNIYSEDISSIAVAEKITTTKTTISTSEKQIQSREKTQDQQIPCEQSSISTNSSLHRTGIEMLNNSSGSVSLEKVIHSKFFTLHLTRLANQPVFNCMEMFRPFRVESSPEEIVLLSVSNLSNRNKNQNEKEVTSRFTFFDSQTLETTESSQFPFEVIDFCLASRIMFFTDGNNLYSWNLRCRELGYDKVDLVDLKQTTISAVSAKECLVVIVVSQSYSYFPSVISVRVKENRTRSSLDLKTQCRSEVSCKLLPSSLTLLDGERFLAMNVYRRVVLFRFVSKNKVMELMKFSLPGRFIDEGSLDITVGPFAHSLIASIPNGELGSLALVDWKKKTSITLMGGGTYYDTEDIYLGNQPIACCFNESTSKLVVLHGEASVERLSLSLFHLQCQNKRMSSLKWIFYATLVLLLIALTGYAALGMLEKL